MRTMKLFVWGIAHAASALFMESPVIWKEIGTAMVTARDTQLMVTNDVTKTLRFTDDRGEFELYMNRYFIHNGGRPTERMG